MPSKFARLLYLLLLIVALTLPYSYTEHTYPIPTFYTEFIALCAYLLMAATIAAYGYSRQAALTQPLGTPKVAWVPLAFGAWVLLQSVVLPTTQPTMNVLAAGCLAAAAMTAQTGFWTARLGLAETTLKWGCYALLVGGAFEVFCQIVQLLGKESMFSPFVLSYGVTEARRPYGNMAQANHLGTYLAFAMSAALYLVQKRRLPVLLWVLVTVVCATGAALTISRTSWIQVTAITLAGWLMAYARLREARWADASAKPVWRDWLLPAGIAAIFILVNIAVRWANVAYDLQLGQSAAERFEDASQIAPRLALWRYGLSMFRSHWLTGVGWGEFPAYQFKLADVLGKVEIANNSHDIMIDLLAKTGLIGFGIVAIGLLLWLARAVRVRLTEERVLGYALIAVFGAHALIEYPQQYLFFLLPIAFILGMLETQAMPRVSPRWSSGVYLAAVLGGVIVAFPILRDYKRSEVLYYGKSPELEYRAAPSTLFGAWGEYGLATLLDMNAANLQYKLAMHEQAIDLLPGETVLKRYAILLALQGRDAQALDVVRRLKVFAEAENDWPDDLASVYEMCDQQGAALAGFKSRLIALYGAVAPSQSDDDSSG